MRKVHLSKIILSLAVLIVMLIITPKYKANDCPHQLAYTGVDEQDQSNIYLSNLCEGTTEKLTNDGNSRRPIWSPTDRSKVIIQRDNALYLLNLESHETISITTNMDSASYATWSPDGNRIVFAGLQNLGDSNDLYSVNTNGSDLQRLTQVSAWVTFSAWSPDNTKIAFVSHHGESSHSIYILDTSERNLLNILAPNLTSIQAPGYLEDYLSWSPDGKFLAFVASRNLYILDISSEAFQELDTYEGVDPASWSPVENRLVFSSVEFPISRIFITNERGEDAIQLTDNSWARYPVWSPDGEKIAFILDHSTGFGLFVMNSDGTDSVQITDDSLNIYDITWANT